MMPTVEQRDQPQLDSEPLRIYKWRRDYALQLGVGYDEARRLALNGADLHQLEQLLNDDCPLDTAIEIVS